jgi:hypothetical protein
MVDPDSSPSPDDERCTNPYDEDDAPKLHRAYRAGWAARHDDIPHTSNPHDDTDAEAGRAWINGWQAAHLRLAQRDRTAGFP